MNTQHGAAEIWRAAASSILTSVAVTSTQAVSGFRQSLTVVSFKGASRIGASAGTSAASGAPTVSLTSTGAHSLVYAVGNDWDRATARTPGNGQTLVHQVVDTSVGDTFWVQARSTDVASAGIVIQMNCSAPTNDRWNLVSWGMVP